MALCIGLGDLGRGYWREKKKKPNTHQDWRPPDQLHGDNCILSLGGQVGEEGRSCHLEERGQS